MKNKSNYKSVDSIDESEQQSLNCNVSRNITLALQPKSAEGEK